MPEITTPDGMSLVTILEQHNRRAIGYLSDEVSIDQDSNLERYLGKPYGDEEEGRSNALSSDIAETVDWALPDLMEPFLSGDRVVAFEPSTEADEAWCEQASDLANHVFWRDNQGVVVLHDAVKTALIQKLGIIKTTWRDDRRIERSTMTGLALPNIEELLADQSLEIEDLQSEDVGGDFAIAPEALSAFSDGQVYTVTIKRTVKDGRVELHSVPPEEFRVSARASTLDGVEYCCHEVEKRRSELIAMGFDRDEVMGLRADSRHELSRSDVRFSGETKSEAGSGSRLSDVVPLLEEYVRADLDGEGEKVWQVFRVGKVVLDEPREVSEHPFVAWSPDRIPGRLIGLALADKVKQTQRIKTHLMRNMLDNVYLANNPRFEVPAQALDNETIGDLLTPRIGGLIRTKSPGLLRPIEVPDRSSTALQAVMFMDGVREQQSGITRNGMSVQSEMLDAKSAYQSRKEDRNEQTRKRLMARMLAETFLVPVFRKILRNLVKYQDRPRAIKLRGKWVDMDPRSWNADMRALAEVGLGHTNRDEELQAGMTIGQLQMTAKDLGLVTPKHLYATAEKIVRAVGWKFADKFFVDPNSQEGQQSLASVSQQAPDPKMIEVQARMQLDQAKAQHEVSMRAHDAEIKANEARIKAEMDQNIAMMKASNEMEIAKLRIAAEQAIAQERLKVEERMARVKASHDDGVNGSSMRFGGAIG